MFTTAELLQLIDTLYAGILDPAAWEAAIGAVCRALGGDAADFELQDTSSHRVSREVFFNIDPPYQASYGDLVGLPDMIVPSRALAAGLAAGAVTAADLARSAPGLVATRFHAEWLRPQRMDDFIIAPLAPSPSLVGGLFITRSRCGQVFDGDEIAALRALRPHLLRVVQARLRLEQADGVARLALDALDLMHQAVVLVDASATIVHANLAAEAALARGDGICAARSVLGCDRADDTATLRRLIGEASTAPAGRPGGMLAAKRRSGRRPLSVMVAPLRGERPQPLGPPATAIVFVTDPEAGPAPPHARLRQLYGLTAGEARVAEALLDTQGLASVAAKLGVSLATVRTLLQRAFENTDTHRQADLVRLMLAHRVPAATNGAALRD
jgi:DNA-binding CsgD family transcriptional regulator